MLDDFARFKIHQCNQDVVSWVQLKDWFALRHGWASGFLIQSVFMGGKRQWRSLYHLSRSGASHGYEQ